jgi:hypothetical protein
MKTPELVSCHCQQCNGKIEFDPATISDGNNMAVCPHCLLRTPLVMPAPPPPAPWSAKLVRIEAGWKWRVEDKLDAAAFVWLGLGVIGFIVGLLAAIKIKASGDLNGYRWFALFGGFFAVAAGSLLWLALKAAAEVIRLLKKQAGLPISDYLVFECSECKTQMTEAGDECPGCGAKFEANPGP